MPSLAYRFIELLIKTVNVKKFYKKTPEQLASLCDKLLKQQDFNPPKSLTKLLSTSTQTINGFPCLYFTPKNPSKKVVLLIHGGGYFMEITSQHWYAIKRIALEKQTSIIAPIYPLAPKHTYQETFAMLSEVYSKILKTYDSKDIILLGDSAGAQIALSFCQECLEKKIAQPSKLILLSPPVDFAPNEALYQKYNELDKIDPMISIKILAFLEKFWANGTPLSDYHISPINGNFTGLPPITVFIGTKELLSAAMDELKEKAQQANVDLTVHIGKDMMHIWPYFMWSKESHYAFQLILNQIC